MPIDTLQRTAFLSRIHLFYSLDEAQVGAVAAKLTEETFEAGKVIVRQGEPGNRLYLIWKGNVKVTRTGRGGEKVLANLVASDYFGEEALIANHHKRSATVTAVDEVHALVLSREQFNELLKQAPKLKANFAVTVSSHKLARRTQFKWLLPDEVIYFLARRHPILLFQALIGPAILGLFGVIGMVVVWYFYMIPVVFWYVALAVSILALLWALWRGVDWGNDYYIVTNSRVLWLEKIVGLYDSRQEAPLSAIQRVSINTEFWGRRFDYGDLIIRTIVGNTLTLNDVNHPVHAAALIEEHWKRSREASSRMEENEMRDALKVRLLQGETKELKISGIVAKPEGKRDPYRGLKSRKTLFSVRFEEKAIVTYRKHILVLAGQVWKASLLIIILLLIPIIDLSVKAFTFADLFKSLGNELLLILWIGFLLAGIGWWIYEYIDWSNDIFQVTADQIMDIDKKPLGEVTSDIAALDNVLSIEYERRGLAQLLFNYGTVFITIGGGKQMAFEDVFNPSAVQQDIERRRLERISKKETDKVKAERERMADWFAAYYNNEQGFRREENPAADGEQNPPPPAPGSEPLQE